MSVLEPATILTLISHPTRILGMIPQLFGCTIFGSFSVGIIMSCVAQGGFLIAFLALIVGTGFSFWITLKDGDCLRILWAQRYFKNKHKARLHPHIMLYRG